VGTLYRFDTVLNPINPLRSNYQVHISTQSSKAITQHYYTFVERRGEIGGSEVMYFELKSFLATAVYIKSPETPKETSFLQQKYYPALSFFHSFDTLF